MKKFTLLFTAAILFNFQFSIFNSLHAQSGGCDQPITFHYDGNDETLTITDPCGRDNLCFELDGDFALWLMKEIDAGPNPTTRTDDNQCKMMASNYIFSRVASFDSVGCRALRVYTWEIADGGISRTNNAIPVTVTMVAKTVIEASDDQIGKPDSPQIPLFAIVIAAVILLAAGATVAIILLRKKKKEDRPIEEKAAELGLEVVEVVSEQKNSGLKHVRSDQASYYTMDIAADFADTAIRKIFLHHTAVKKMYDFFKQSLESSEQTQETGCYFIGCWENADGRNDVYDISVEDIVLPGDDIVPGEFSFSFGKKISLSLTSTIDEATNKSGRGYVQTVWMHSHPGLGLFLSAHDLLVQQQLHYPEAPGRLAAFVIDTNTPNWDFAVFTPKVAGGMNNKEELRRTYSLDSLYEWSRHLRTNSPIEESGAKKQEEELKEKYHSVQVNHQGSTKTLNVFFSGRAINMIDDIVYRADGQCKLGGYLIGNIDSKGNLFIEECNENYSSNSLGIFITDNQTPYSEIQERYLTSNVWICAIVSRSDEELWILTRPSADAPCPTEGDIAVTSMRPMKEWLRRRRVYK